MVRFLLAIVIACGAAMMIAPSEDRVKYPSPRKIKHDQPLAAAKFRYQQRLSEHGDVPANALMTAKQQRDRLLAQQQAGQGGIAGDTPPSIGWVSLGPGNVGGRIRAIIIHPTQPNNMWVGTASGGIWKTTNGGTSWFALDDYLPSLAVGCMAIDPVNPDVVYAGTGEGFFETVEGSSNTAAIRGAGVFKTIDGGTTWTQLPSTANPDFYFVNRLAIDPNNNQIILAGTSAGIFRSINGGTTWTQADAEFTYDVQFHPSDSSKLIAGVHDGPPLYSLDGGQTWQNATGLTAHRSEVRYAPSSPSTTYAAASNGGSIRVYRSLDGGQTYTLQTSGGGISTYAAYNNVLWVHPNNANTLLLGGIQMYRSTNAGVNFSQTFGSVHPDHHAIVQHPSFNGTTNRIVFFGHDGGIHRTIDVDGNSAQELNNNLGITQFYGAAIHPVSGVVVGGTQDNGTLRFTGDTEAWTSTFGGDGGFCAVDPLDPNYFYGEVYWLQIFRSTNAGVNGNYIWSGISDAGSSATSNFIPFFMLDPNVNTRMLAGGRQLWRSNNVKDLFPTWASIKPTIEINPPPAPSAPTGAHFAENNPFNISTIAVAENDSDIIWVGYNNGEVWKTANGTAVNPSWTRVDAPAVGPQLPNRWISRIVIDRTVHSRVHVSILGWAGDNVWRTENAGDSWADISGSGPTGLPDAPVSALAQHRIDPAWLFAGTDIGLFTSIDDGANWTAIASGLPAAPIDELVWNNNNSLMAVTHGRGLYVGNVTPASNADVNSDGVVDIDDLLAIIMNWGSCPNCLLINCAADVNDDCLINVDDLLFVIEHWGRVVS